MFGAILSGIGSAFGGGSGSVLGRLGGALGLGGSPNRAVKRLGQGYDEARKTVAPTFATARGRFSPYAETGGRANTLTSSLLGLTPGDTSGAEGLAQFRNSTGYRDTMDQALGGVATNAAAKGLLDSSGTGKTFQREASRLAQGSFGDFLDRLTQQQGMGLDASGAQADIDLAEGSFLNENILGKAETMAKKKNSSFLGKLFGG
jgi:hypothetical protein